MKEIENIVNIYIDESNQTGLIKISEKHDDILNYGHHNNPDLHRYFGLGFLILSNQDKVALNAELLNSPMPKLKGTDLLRPENNEELEHVLSRLSKYKNNFYLSFNDKLFNLARDFLFYMFKNITNMIQLGEIVSILANQLVRDKKTKWEIKVVNFFNGKESENNFLFFWKNYVFDYSKKTMLNPNVKIEYAISIFKKELIKRDVNLEPLADEITSVHINNFCSLVSFLKDGKFINIYKKNKIIIWHDQNNFIYDKNANKTANKIGSIVEQMKIVFFYIFDKSIDVDIEFHFLDSKVDKIINFVDNFVSISTGLLSRNVKFFSALPTPIGFNELQNMLKKDDKLTEEKITLEEKETEKNVWNYEMLHFIYQKILSVDGIQLYCSFDAIANILSIFNIKINEIETKWHFSYSDNYNNWYIRQFGTAPSTPLNSIPKK